MKKLTRLTVTFVFIMVCISSKSYSRTYLGAAPGDGGDANPATFHFDYQNQDFQMTQPDGTPLADTEAQLTYGTAWKIIYNNQDYVTSQGLSLQGTSLTNQDWTSLVYPPVGRVAVDPATGRFKFAQTWEGTTNPLAPDFGFFTRYADMALNDSGYGFCAYYYYGGAAKALVRNYDPQYGWQSITEVSSNSVAAISAFEIDINSSGEAFSVLMEAFGAQYRITANRYVPAWGWSGTTPIDAGTGLNAQAPVLDMNDDGNAFCAFYEPITPNTRIWATEYKRNVTWYAPVTIDAGAYPAFKPAIALNNTGTAFCVFRQQDSGGVERIWGNQYLPGAGWQTAITLDHGAPNNADNPRVALGENGYAICVFIQSDGINNRVSANVYVPGSGWQGAQRIDNGDGYPNINPEIAINQYGTGVCVFRRTMGVNYRVYANHYLPGSGWQGAVAVDGGSSASPFVPSGLDIDITDTDEAFCVFGKYDASARRLYANKYQPGAGWTGPVRIDANTGDDTDRPAVVVNNRGLALAAFEQRLDGVFRLYANRYLSNVPAGTFQVNYSSLDPAPTPDLPTRTSVQITNRKLEPLRGQQAVIQYTLAEAGMASIKIYDLQGALVKTLLNEYKARGTHTLSWNASNADNATVASGVYLVSITLPGLNTTEKIVVLK